MADEKMQDKILNEEELDQVAGGTREEFNNVCATLKSKGIGPMIKTRDSVRKFLMDKFNIEVKHWNTGDRGSEKEDRAEIYYQGSGLTMTLEGYGGSVTYRKGETLSVNDLCDIIRAS